MDLRNKMQENGLEAYLIPTSDAHQSEYLSKYDKTREYVSGFTGSAGSLLVLKDTAYLWTDGRYFLQAEKQLEGSGINLCKMGEKGVPTLLEFISSHLSNSTLGMNGKIISLNLYEDIRRAAPNGKLMTDIDLVAEIWEDRPLPRRRDAYLLPESIAGLSAKQKINQVRDFLKGKNSEATVIGALEDICYLFNIRGADVECNPVLTSYAYIDQSKAVLFTEQTHLPRDVMEYLKENEVEVLNYQDVFDYVNSLKGRVYLDPSRINVYLAQRISAELIYGLNFTTSMKAIKTESELKSIRETMVKDGVALGKFLYWLEKNKGMGITEFEVSEKLLEFRKEQEGFLEPSFETIAGYGPNGAVIHYKPEKDTALKLEEKGFLLLDSGGQYRYGTTDITRTIPLGPLTDEEKRNYTLVLKSHIHLAMAKFVEGTTGYQLDALSRQPLWKYALDYKHGTGHGVGFLLGVHEGPQSISNRWIDVPIEENMITSNEPGLYIADSHGIRIESLIRSKKWKESELGIFLEFETITVCPIDTRPVLKDLLIQEEIDWLNDYNKWARERIMPYLTKEESASLAENSKEI